MNLSDFTLEFIGSAISGDTAGFPYRSGPNLVKFFNQFGARDVYPTDGGFPTRRIYAQDKLKDLNGVPLMREVISKALDPREFSKVSLEIDGAVELFNGNLKYDGYEIVPDGLMD
jgi:hypothetical protein